MATDPAVPDSSPPAIGASMETAVGVSVDELSALLALSGVKGLGPQKFKEIHESGTDPAAVLREPTRLPTTGKRGDELRRAIAALDAADRDLATDRAARAIAKAFELRGRILTYRSVDYPASVYRSNNPVEVLYVLGPPALLARPAVACVGSREIRVPYADAHAASPGVPHARRWPSHPDSRPAPTGSGTRRRGRPAARRCA